jgi:hypothetical protein
VCVRMSVFMEHVNVCVCITKDAFIKPDVEVHTCNPSTGEAKEGGL